MIDRLKRIWRSGAERSVELSDQALAHSCAGRVVSALTFIVAIFCLALWILAFLLLQDRLFSKVTSGNLFTDLTCITFFGGLIIAFFVGSMAGNFLRRAFWRMLVERKKH
ncbi:MAG TPA: hypothetical protein VMC09_15875 [Anaerolineales bacterium]|nr:hypothetical protein [Anaerolineales bacterium]